MTSDWVELTTGAVSVAKIKCSSSAMRPPSLSISASASRRSAARAFSSSTTVAAGLVRGPRQLADLRDRGGLDLLGADELRLHLGSGGDRGVVGSGFGGGECGLELRDAHLRGSANGFVLGCGPFEIREPGPGGFVLLRRRGEASFQLPDPGRATLPLVDRGREHGFQLLGPGDRGIAVGCRRHRGLLELGHPLGQLDDERTGAGGVRVAVERQAFEFRQPGPGGFVVVGRRGEASFQLLDPGRATLPLVDRRREHRFQLVCPGGRGVAVGCRRHGGLLELGHPLGQLDDQGTGTGGVRVAVRRHPFEVGDPQDARSRSLVVSGDECFQLRRLRVRGRELLTSGRGDGPGGLGVGRQLGRPVLLELRPARLLHEGVFERGGVVGEARELLAQPPDPTVELGTLGLQLGDAPVLLDDGGGVRRGGADLGRLLDRVSVEHLGGPGEALLRPLAALGCTATALRAGPRRVRGAHPPAAPGGRRGACVAAPPSPGSG